MSQRARICIVCAYSITDIVWHRWNTRTKKPDGPYCDACRATLKNQLAEEFDEGKLVEREIADGE